MYTRLLWLTVAAIKAMYRPTMSRFSQMKRQLLIPRSNSHNTSKFPGLQSFGRQTNWATVNWATKQLANNQLGDTFQSTGRHNLWLIGGQCRKCNAPTVLATYF